MNITLEQSKKSDREDSREQTSTLIANMIKYDDHDDARKWASQWWHKGCMKTFVNRDDDREQVPVRLQQWLRWTMQVWTQRELQWTLACSIAMKIATNKQQLWTREANKAQQAKQGGLHVQIAEINQVCKSIPLFGQKSQKKESAIN